MRAKWLKFSILPSIKVRVGGQCIAPKTRTTLILDRCTQFYKNTVKNIMGLFDFFKKEPEKTFQTKLGIFKLNKTKSSTKIWTNNLNPIFYSARGNELTPDTNSINFLENINSELEILNEKFTNKFLSLFKEADLEIDFKNWTEKYKIIAINVISAENENRIWELTFQELESPFYHFTTTIENKNLSDFAIDS